MKKFIFLLFALVLMASSVMATPMGVEFSEPLENQRVDKGVVFDFSIESSLTAGASYNYLVTPLFDLVLDIETGSEGALSLVVYEDPTTEGGATGTAYNENRTSSLAATTYVTLTSSPTTVSATGTAIYTKVEQDGTINKRLVLDKDNTYLLAITNVSAATYNVSVGGSFVRNSQRIK